MFPVLCAICIRCSANGFPLTFNSRTAIIRTTSAIKPRQIHIHQFWRKCMELVMPNPELSETLKVSWNMQEATHRLSFSWNVDCKQLYHDTARWSRQSDKWLTIKKAFYAFDWSKLSCVNIWRWKGIRWRPQKHTLSVVLMSALHTRQNCVRSTPLLMPLNLLLHTDFSNWHR